jgi:hypothetical protein
MLKCALGSSVYEPPTLTVDPPALLKLAAGARFKSVAPGIYVHPVERLELRVQGPILSDAEPDSDCPKGPLVLSRPRARTPKAPQPSRPCRSTALTGSVPGGPPAATGKCRAGTDRPAPPQAEAGDTATQGRPSPVTLTIVDLRRPAALAAQARAAP